VYCTPQNRLAAGGALELAPHLFGAALLTVPFVDLVVSQSDATIAWAAYEFREWGCAHVRAEYEHMHTFCPVSGLRARYRALHSAQTPHAATATTADSAAAPASPAAASPRVSADHYFPHVLLTGGLNDPRLGFWEPLKFTACFRHWRHEVEKRRTAAVAAASGLVVFDCDLDGGHYHQPGSLAFLRTRALYYAFLCTVLPP
jgi:oligopeptidase B